MQKATIKGKTTIKQELEKQTKAHNIFLAQMQARIPNLVAERDQLTTETAELTTKTAELTTKTAELTTKNLELIKKNAELVKKVERINGLLRAVVVDKNKRGRVERIIREMSQSSDEHERYIHLLQIGDDAMGH